MKDFFSQQMRTLLYVSAALIVVSALVVRFSHQEDTFISRQTPTTVTPGLPAFTSAVFETGDAIGALGPEWTLVRQNDVVRKDVKVPNGMRATRETLVHLLHTPSTLLVTELTIEDAGLAAVALSSKSNVATAIGGRAGYVIPIPSLTSSSGFLIAGTSTALLLEYGEESSEHFLMWPTEVPSAIQAYINVVPVR